MKPKCYSYIRFSTPQQIKGSSLKRQLTLSKEYAEKHNLELDESLTIKDFGISAYATGKESGKHRDKGNLGLFIDAIKAGKIPPGSFLIVENLDRLSREEITTAQFLFLEIIKKGITIVTLTDGQEYSKKSVDENPLQLIVSITVLMRGHEESKTKSQRLQKAWEFKRKNIDNKKLTSMCPGWLKLSKDKTEFIIIEKRADIINKIFQWSASGIGRATIVKKLNEEGIKSFRKKTWHASYIQKVLSSI